MRILHLSWEYPPVIYGGLGRHVHALARAQASLGHEVAVITQAPTSEDLRLDEGPVHVVRAGGRQMQGDLLAHVAAMEQDFIDQGLDLVCRWRPDAIHAHDWMVTHAAVALRRESGVPLTATIHATEAGRNQGWVSTDLSTAIHCLEWWLANTADELITCSQHMREEVRALFGVQGATVIPNGIEAAEWTCPPGAAERIRAAHPGRPLVVYTGRVEWEKGVQTLLAAVPEIRSHHPDLAVIVAGRGSYLPSLREQAEQIGPDADVALLGWVSEDDLRGIVTAADLAVAPSLYEPFGLVALEAAALGTPVLVANTGGLAEFAGNGRLASTFTPGDPRSLAAAVLSDLSAPEAMAARAQRATRALAEQYDWSSIAGQTVSVYNRAVSTGRPSEHAPQPAVQSRHDLRPPQYATPPGHLLGSP
ncbi:MAG: glycosyltransferase family 4 protein [Candidatus Nanopelagicales bacterium]